MPIICLPHNQIPRPTATHVIAAKRKQEAEDVQLAVEEPSSSGSASHFLFSWEPAMACTIAKTLQDKNRDMPFEQQQQGNKQKKPYMIALVGMPGSGKSVSASILATILEEEFGIKAMVMPHDGYHYTIKELHKFPDVEDAIYRRGAPDTFNSKLLLRDLKRIRCNYDNDDGEDGEETIIKLPGFDHANGDPEPNKHIFNRDEYEVLICEGLYLLHDDHGWEDIANMFDLKIYMDTNIDVCIDRVKTRNQCIPGYTKEEIQLRCEKVDRANALKVLSSKPRADVIVSS